MPGETDKFALMVAHPGHELCVYGWMKLHKPVVYALTDGSAPSRLNMTAKILEDVGATTGGFYGVTTDSEIYSALLEGNLQFFADLAHRFADVVLDEGITMVAGDAAEGYSPTHDVCRAVTSAGVAIANRRRPGVIVGDYEFTVIGRQDLSARDTAGTIRVRLDDRTFQQKIDAMRSCPDIADEVSAGLDRVQLSSLQSFAPFAGEVEEMVNLLGGVEGFRTECLRPASGKPFICTHGQSPFYERYGEALATAGKYSRVIRYRDHYLPVAESLHQLTEAAHALSA